MRPLFISEQRYIRNTLWHWTKTELKVFDPVVLEHYEPPRSPTGIRFNNDYTLQFASSQQLKGLCKSFGGTILPNTLGADVYLTVDKDTLRPLMTELLAGEAFSIKYYRQYVEQVEYRLERLSRPVRIKQCSYCRVFVIENDICFLAFPSDRTPLMHGERLTLVNGEDAAIDCYVDGDEVLCFDGWVRTEASAPTEQVLVALPDPHAWPKPPSSGQKSKEIHSPTIHKEQSS